MKLVAPALPLPIRGCAMCASFPERRITVALIDIYVQHHRMAHGRALDIGWQQTYEWVYGPSWGSIRTP